MSPPQVSVVIPTYQRPALLARCLEALARQTLPPDRFEIVVVDDGRDEATRQQVREFAQAHPAGPQIVCIEPRGTRGPAAARNRGWRQACAPVIAFTDDDTVPAADWLDTGLHVLGSLPRAVAVAGAIEVPVADPPTDHERNIQLLERAGFVTANCFVRRAALQEVGGFDERFTRAWREDTDLYFNLRRAGQVVFSHWPLVVHPVRAPRWGQSLRAHANLRFDALLYKKHRALYRRYVRPGPPWRYYLTVIIFALAVAGAVGQRPLTSAALIALWLALTAQFTAQRLRGTLQTPGHRIEILLTSVAIPFAAVFWRLTGALRWRVFFL